MTAAAAGIVAAPRPARWARTIAWSAFGVGMVLRVVELAMASRLGPGSAKFIFGAGLPAFTAAVIFGTACGLVGAIIVARRPGNAVGWIYVLGGLAQGILGAGLAYSAGALPAGPSEPAVLFAWLNGVGNATAPLAAVALVLALYPDGRFVSPRWGIVAALVAVGSAVRAFEVGLGSDRLVVLESYANPYRATGLIGQVASASGALNVGYWVLQVAAVIGAAALVVRYRRAELDGRRQIRWLLLALVPVVAGSVPLAYGELVLRPGDSFIDALAVLFVSLALPPVATLIAITRYRLYEIDRIVSRALLYASLTAILAGAFTAGVGLAQRLFVAVTGESSDAAIVLTTLVVATAYAPLRRRLEAIVDRRFKYEGASFGAYRDELTRFLSLADPKAASSRLARETVIELRATGAAVLAEDGAVTASAGEWPVREAARIAISGGSGALAVVVAGPRMDGATHDPRRVAALAELAGLVADATRLPRRVRR